MSDDSDASAETEGWLQRLREVLDIQAEQSPLTAEALKGAGSKLHIILSPDNNYRRAVLAGSVDRLYSILVMSLLIGAVLLPIWQFDHIAFDVVSTTLTAIVPQFLTGAVPPLNETTVEAIDGIILALVAWLTAVALYPVVLALQPRPKRDGSVSANLAMNGDPMASPKLFYISNGVSCEQIKEELRDGIEGNQYRKETRRIGWELGIDTENVSDNDIVIIEFQFQESQPMDGLIRGWTVADVVETDAHIGLLLESAVAELDQATLPLWLSVTVAARPRDKSRIKCKKERLKRTIDKAALRRNARSIGRHSTKERDKEELKPSNEKRLEQLPDATAELFDAAVALIAVVETDNHHEELAAHADAICNSLEMVTNDFVKVDWSLRQSSRWPWRKLRFQRMKRRLDRGDVPYSTPTRLIGPKKRNNMVVDSEQVMGLLAISGDGSHASKQALGPTPKDETPTGPPPGDASETIKGELPYGGDDEEERDT